MKIVCELGANTQGDLDTALRMVEAAAEAGADGIKVQAYDVSDFLPQGHEDWAMFEQNRLSWLAIERVQDETVALGMEFGATPTSLRGVARLAEMKVDWLKNGSDFLLRHDLIEAMLATGIETWVSTGMATHREIHMLPLGVKLMACTSLYPCPDDAAALNRLNGMWHGYSDHTQGTVAAVACAALGAEMLEKHFTLDKTLIGPDHAFSADAPELAVLVRDVRRIEAMLPVGEMTHDELANRDKWRVTEGSLRG